MDFELSEEQRAFQDVARQFARAEFAPKAKEWDEKYIFPVESLRKAAALGFGGMYIREDVGGSALSRLDAAIIFEELAQGCTSTAAYMSIHNMATWMIDRYGTDDQKARWLAPLLAGEIRSCFAMTEPDVASSDATNIAARIRPDGDEYVIDGRKWWTTGALHPRCQIAILMGKTDPDAPRHRQQSMILVPIATRPQAMPVIAPALSAIRVKGAAPPSRAKAPTQRLVAVDRPRRVTTAICAPSAASAAVLVKPAIRPRPSSAFVMNFMIPYSLANRTNVMGHKLETIRDSSRA